jgi:hypothetical protein
MTVTWKATVGVALVFVLGCLTGVLGSGVFFAHRTTVFLQRGSAGYVELLEWRLTRNLDLDADQKEKIHGYFMENLSDRKQLQAQMQPSVQKVNQLMVQNIKSVLRPDQIRIFHQNLTEFRKRLGRAEFAPRPGNPPPPGEPTDLSGAPSEPQNPPSTAP